MKEWRQALYRVGIFVFKDAFREESFSGFSLYDDVFPIIYVNNSAAKTRQIFTLFHELGHLLFRTSGIDPLDDHYVERLPDRPRQSKSLCNRFAAQFLVPEAAFEAAFAGQRHPNDGRNARGTLSRQPRIHLSEIPRPRFDQARRLWRARPKMGRAKAGRQRRQSLLEQARYLGRDYVALAFSQYHQNRIDETQLGEYLDMKPKNVGTLEEYFVRGVQ